MHIFYILIFDFPFLSSTFPSEWKRAHIIPLLKIANLSSFSQYRPISILLFLSNVLKRIAHSKFAKYLHSTIILHPLQLFHLVFILVMAQLLLMKESQMISVLLCMINVSLLLDSLILVMLFILLTCMSYLVYFELSVASFRPGSGLVCIFENNIASWAQDFGLHVNPLKLQALLVGSNICVVCLPIQIY